MVAERDLILGGECTMPYAEDVLLRCMLENCMVFIIQCHPNKFYKKYLGKKCKKQQQQTLG